MRESTYSRKISNLMKDFLAKDEWRYSFDEKTGVFRFGLNLSGTIKNISYLIDVKEDAYIVYSYSPIGADNKDEAIITRMAEFVCRANYGLKNGNFELDMRDGEIRYKVFVDCDGVLPSEEIIKTSIYCPAMMFDRYGSGIVDIIFNGISAKSAIDKCEKRSEEELKTLLESENSDAGEVGEILDRLAAHFSDATHMEDSCSDGETTA